jgi:spore coat polysaccharide biosynthesis protein SpsF (cytidylyltransferase family)
MTPCCGQSETPPKPADASTALVVIQARLSSERFPEKILADLCGKPVLQHVIDKAKQIVGVADVVVAVPNEAVRQRLAEKGIASIAVSRVSENDVLGRFAWLANQWKSHEVFIRITGDCPMLDPQICEAVLARFNQGNLDYCSNVVTNYVDGTDCEVFSREALMTADREASTDYEREHVTPWIKQNLRCDVVLPPKGSKGGKTSIDTPEELDALRKTLCR